MSTDHALIAKARAAGEAARRRRIRSEQFKALCTAGTIVLIGLLLAVLYCLLTHRISA